MARITGRCAGLRLARPMTGNARLRRPQRPRRGRRPHCGGSGAVARHPAGSVPGSRRRSRPTRRPRLVPRCVEPTTWETEPYTRWWQCQPQGVPTPATHRARSRAERQGSVCRGRRLPAARHLRGSSARHPPKRLSHRREGRRGKERRHGPGAGQLPPRQSSWPTLIEVDQRGGSGEEQSRDSDAERTQPRPSAQVGQGPVEECDGRPNAHDHMARDPGGRGVGANARHDVSRCTGLIEDRYAGLRSEKQAHVDDPGLQHPVRGGEEEDPGPAATRAHGCLANEQRGTSVEGRQDDQRGQQAEWVTGDREIPLDELGADRRHEGEAQNRDDSASPPGVLCHVRSLRGRANDDPSASRRAEEAVWRILMC